MAEDVLRVRLGLSVPGTCCSCGYAGEDETPCEARDDGSHCEHWQDGWDETRAAERIQGLTEHVKDLEMEVHLLRRELGLAYDVIHALPKDAMDDIESAKLLALLKQMEDTQKRREVQTCIDLHIEQIRDQVDMIGKLLLENSKLRMELGELGNV